MSRIKTHQLHEAVRSRPSTKHVEHFAEWRRRIVALMQSMYGASYQLSRCLLSMSSALKTLRIKKTTVKSCLLARWPCDKVLLTWGQHWFPARHPGGRVGCRVRCTRMDAQHALCVVDSVAEVPFAPKSHTVSKASSPVIVTPPLFSAAFSVRGINHARLNATHSDN